MKPPKSALPISKTYTITVETNEERDCIDRALSILDKNGFKICKKDSCVLDNEIIASDIGGLCQSIDVIRSRDGLCQSIDILGSR